MTADIQKLPSLPGSDHETLVRNRVDSFYGKKPSDFWQGYVENTKIEKPKKTYCSKLQNFVLNYLTQCLN